MTWFRIDDSFYDHPKVFDAPDCAVALWARAGAWAARNLTDGFVPSGMPARLCDDPDTAVRELTKRGLWKRASGGFQFHDWTDFQPTADAVKTLREQRAEAGRRGGRVRAERHRGAAGGRAGMNSLPTEGANLLEPSTDVDNSVTSAAVANGKQESSKGQASASPVAKQNATPARPDPAFKGGALGDPLTPGARGPAPSPQCEEHDGIPNPPPCGRCRDARRAREIWDLADAERRRNQPHCRRHPSHRGQPADNCALCRSEALAAEEAS